ncbi:MAG: hypothetical protein EZS28_024986 [Streblomastix strix]|nr:MAG: hypothetical protein EZS28_024986 [Streblomastix strix]
MLYRLAQKQHPDASLKLSIEMFDGIRFSTSLEAKYYYGGNLIDTVHLMLGQSYPFPETFCQDYLAKEIPLDGELGYFYFGTRNYKTLFSKLGFPNTYNDQLRLEQNGSYWIWFSPSEDGIDTHEQKKFYHGYEFRIYDYDNYIFNDMLNQYSPTQHDGKEAYWAFDYDAIPVAQRAYLEKKHEINHLHLWIYQSYASDNDLMEASWNFVPGYDNQISAGWELLTFYDALTQTITISTTQINNTGALNNKRDNYLSYLSSNLNWTLSEYFIDHLYVHPSANYGIIVSETVTDEHLHLSYFTIQLVNNPPFLNTSESYRELSVPEKHGMVFLGLFTEFSSINPHYLSYESGYPTLTIQFLSGGDLFYNNLRLFMQADWNRIDDNLYTLRDDPDLSVRLSYDDVLIIKFFPSQIERDSWPAGELTSFLSTVLPVLNSNPEKYHFYYNGGTVRLEMVEGYEGEIQTYYQLYLSKLNSAYYLERSYRTPCEYLVLL